MDQLDEAIDAIMTDGEAGAFRTDDAGLIELVALGAELRSLPRESFKSSLRAALGRSTAMTTSGTQIQEPAKPPAAGNHTITPYLTVKRAEQLVDFVKQAFGAVEVFRTVGSAGGLHAEVTIGESKLMIGGYEAVEEKPMALHLYVPDADEVYRRALAAGATSLGEPVDQFYGDREAGVKDASGNVWYIATHKLGPAGTYIPEGMRPVTPAMALVGTARFIEFVEAAFMAEEVARHQSPEGVIQHAVVRIGDSMIELGEAHGSVQPLPPALFMTVADVGASYERALAAGATSLQAPIDQAYGRTAWVKDAWDNTWYLTAPIQGKGE